MEKTNFLTFAAVIISSILCMAGQSPRKEVLVAQETQHSVSNTEAREENPISQKSKQKKSAAQRSMESDSETSMNQKSAAKRSME
jgi:hypothetical protein